MRSLQQISFTFFNGLHVTHKLPLIMVIRHGIVILMWGKLLERLHFHELSVRELNLLTCRSENAKVIQNA